MLDEERLSHHNWIQCVVLIGDWLGQTSFKVHFCATMEFLKLYSLC